MKIVQKYIPNYTLNLIDASDVKQTELFRSDLQLIFGMLKYKTHKEELRNYIKQNETYFKKLDRETYQAVRELLHSEKELKEVSRNEKGEMDMCKALEDLYKSGVDAGMAAGTQAGIQTGIQVLIRTYREFQLPETEILSRIQKEFSLKKDEALAYLKN